MARALTRELASWVASLAWDQVPKPTREVLRAAVLDTLGAGLYGSTTPWARVVREWAERAAGKGVASVWGAPAPSLGAAEAALVNGVAAHSFELDDYHQSKIHPGAVVLPAVLALGEASGATGTDLLTAAAAGYEVMIRSALALEPVGARLRGWHLTGVTGPLGAAAACARLLRLDPERTAWALGLGATQGSGLFAFNADGSMSKRLHPGRAAHAGVLAAELASVGFTGPAEAYEAGDGGFLKAFSEGPRPERLTADLGRAWCTDATSFKPYSCCGSLHAYVDAALALRAKHGPPREGTRVRAGLSRVVGVQCGFPYEPSTVMHAQMSLRYCVAVALLEGAALPEEFAPEKLHDPRIVDLARRIELVPDAALDRLYPEHFAGWVAIERGALTERADVLDPTGSIARPMAWPGLVEKFRRLLAGAIPAPALDRTEAAVRRLEETTARDLVAALVKD